MLIRFSVLNAKVENLLQFSKYFLLRKFVTRYIYIFFTIFCSTLQNMEYI